VTDALNEAEAPAGHGSEPQPLGAPLQPEAANPPPFAAKAGDLEAIRNSVIDAAGISGGLWISYLGVVFYLLVAAGGVTHRDLFLARQVKLPFLNVDLPLEGFFWLGPALLLVLHAYVLLHFVMLAGKVGMFDAQLRAQITDPNLRTQLRRQLPSNIFVQFLAGPREERDGIVGFLLWLIAIITLVVSPVGLLVFFQLQFLPYHNEIITWWQRIAVLIDLGLLWKLWRRIDLRAPAATVDSEARGLPAVLQHIGVIVLALLTGASLPLMLVIATFPGERLTQELQRFHRIPLQEMLVAGKVDTATRKPVSLWSNRIVLPGIDVTESKTLAAPQLVSMRARHLEGAVLIDAILQKIDFTAAHLEDARLDRADLRGAKFECAQPLGEGPRPGIVGHATETLLGLVKKLGDCAHLERARLDDAMLQGASLNGALLHGASLFQAQLEGARLYSAQLQGADLSEAKLQGSYFQSAELKGALLDFAQLQGAWLYDARLQGSSLSEAQLQAVTLDSANLEGASLVKAQLQAASLDRADLRGAKLTEAALDGASLRAVQVWRADVRKASTNAARIATAQIGPKEPCSYHSGSACDQLASALSSLVEKVQGEIPDRERRNEIVSQLESSLDPIKPLDGEEEMMRRWSDLQASFPPVDLYEQTVAERWRTLGCAVEGAPYVLSGLARMMATPSASPFARESKRLPELAADYLKEECAGAHGIPESTRTMLVRLRDSAPQQGAAK